MCKDKTTQDGRRCPCDTSEARQLRRMKARSASRNLDRVSESFVAAPPTTFVDEHFEQLEKEMARTTIKDVELNIQTVQKLQEDVEKVEQLKPIPGGKYSMMVNGERITGTKSDILNHILVEQELAVTKVGLSINHLVDSATGVTDQELYAEYKMVALAQMNLFDQVKADKKKAEMGLFMRLSPKSALFKELSDQIKLSKMTLEGVKLEWLEAAETEYNYQLSRFENEKKNTQMILDFGDENLRKKVFARIEKTKELLSQVREMGGDLTFHPASDKNSVNILQEALTVYPKDWVNRAETAPVVVKRTTKRAHYSPWTIHYGKYKVVDSLEVIHEENWQPNPKDETHLGYIPVDPETGKYVNSEGQEETVLHTGSTGYKAWVRESYDYFHPNEHASKTLKDGTFKPAGRGWEEKTFERTIVNPETQAEEKIEYSQWVRKNYREKTQPFTAPELLISQRETPHHENKNYTVALHEYAHRMEHVGSSTIKPLEEQFLKRRTTDANGERQTMQKLIDLQPNGKYDSSELTRADNFANNYIGKEYESGSREVLSMGMEAIFAGSQGGLMGFGNYKADPDMKNFIIGLLASGK